MSPLSGLTLGAGLLALGLALIDFSWRRRPGARNHGV